MPTAESLLFVAVRVAAVTVAWLATYAAHSTAFLGAAWLATARRDRTTPELRDALWKAALVGSLLTATLAAAGALDPLGGRHDAGRAVEAREWRALPALPAPPAAAPRPADGGASTEAYGARLPSSGGRARAVPLALTFAWLAYAAVVLARVAGATRRARASLGPRAALGDPAVLAALADVAARLGVRRVPRLTVAESAASPVVLGTSEICVPRRFLSDLTPEEQSGVLAHEVAHLVRRDPWWLLLAVTLESLFFFQPLNRLARVRLQDEAELLSDALAVRRATSGVVLARCLARVAEWVTGRAAGDGRREELMAPALAERDRLLAPRVRHLLGAAPAAPAAPTRAAAARHAAAGGALAAAVLALAPAFSAGAARAWGTPAFRWAGAVAAGQSVEVKGLMGAIRAEPTPDPVVTVLATRHGRATDPDVRFEVVRHAAGVTVCAVYPTPAGTPPNECRPGRAGRQRNTPANDVEVEFLVRVPRGVGLVARSATGDITTGLLTAPVSAHSAAGHVDVRTTEYADASSASGNVSVRMGRAAWPDTLRVATRSGNIRVWLPAAADAHVTASTRAGTVRTDFALAGTRRSVWARLRPGADRGDRASGTLGAGGRHLLVESTAGTIAVRRGDRLPD